MKHYHSIEKNVEDYIGHHVFGFNKIDGSNFVAEWNRKLSKKTHFTNGFGKFGTRTETIKDTSNPFVLAIDIFEDKYTEILNKIFIDEKIFRGLDTITVYGEFAGPHSFAGKHEWTLDKDDFNVTIFDMFLYKKDFLKPADFIEIFDKYEIEMPALITKGILDSQMIEDIVTNIYNIPEGVVLKGVINGKVFMVKVNTQHWLNKVRSIYGINNNIE